MSIPLTTLADACRVDNFPFPIQPGRQFMPHKQSNLQRQLTAAQQQFEVRDAQLKDQGVGEKDRSKDPAWRQLKAKRLKLKSRLRSAAAVVELTEEVLRRKAEKPAKGEGSEETKPAKKKGGAKQKAGKKE